MILRVFVINKSFHTVISAMVAAFVIFSCICIEFCFQLPASLLMLRGLWLTNLTSFPRRYIVCRFELEFLLFSYIDREQCEYLLYRNNLRSRY